MKTVLPMLLIICCLACNGNPTISTDMSTATDTAMVPVAKKANVIFSNDRFKNVTVDRVGDTIIVKGRARVFEAALSWVVEDGHDEIASGHAMADMGAPEWGKFGFSLIAEKKIPNSVLHLILFEASAMDGSRQGELVIPLG